MRITVINGPNLNLLGTRRPDIYGDWSLADLESACRSWAEEVDAEVDTYQSNHEGDIIDRLHMARGESDAIVINPGAFTHYSFAIRDAIEAIETPTVEVHLSNIRAREPWRQHSVVSEVCVATILGRGTDGYRDAIWHLAWQERWPVHTIAYGAEEHQIADLRLPKGPGPHPVLMLFHGGFWRDTAGRDLLDGAAVELARRGWATWNIAYLSGAGSSAGAMSDASKALDAMAGFAADHELDLDRIVTVGFEAGGQLAMSLAKPSNQSRGFYPAAVAGIAAISDLESAYVDLLGNGAVAEYVGTSPDQAPDRYAALSPSALVPLGVPIVLIHGDADQVVPVAMSRNFAGQAADAGDEVIYHELETIGHEAVSLPGTMAFDRVADELDQLSSRAAAGD